MNRLLRMLATLVLAVAIVGGTRWYLYVANTDSPFDEVGIALNSRMPEPLRKWGCERLKSTFPNTLPPYGCQNPALPTSWMW